MNVRDHDVSTSYSASSRNSAQFTARVGLIVPPWLTSKSEFTQEEDGRPTSVIMFEHFFAKLPLPLNRFF